jgi:hypothetical protein
MLLKYFYFTLKHCRYARIVLTPLVYHLIAHRMVERLYYTYICFITEATLDEQLFYTFFCIINAAIT